ncbi:MAG TPA: hypothetical protein VMM93_06565, partial [Vicinamibacterales bacterium]|nr:hypothetical protein [Vicinamibacterales bacterium]
ADKGKTWTFMSNENNRPMYYSHILVDPSDENTVYVGGLNAQQSTDGGKTWRNLHGGGGGRNMGHVDNHAIWVDPNDRRHIMYGSDGGLAVSWDFGDAWEAQRLWAVGQSYHVSVDMQRPYRVCTGFQDNGSWCGPSSKRSGAIWMFDWNGMGGGDGFQTAVDPTDPKVIYSESQNGNLRRYDLNVEGGAASIRPTAGGGRGGGGGGGANIVPAPPPDTQINYNWNSPFRISPHNPRKVLYGGNRFFVSLDRGDTWRMSEPLGKNFNASERSMMGLAYSLPSCGRGGGAPGPCIPSRGDGVQGNEAATILEIAESPLVPGIYWAGTADGNIQVSQDDGYTWTEVGSNVPGGTREYWVSGLEASWFDAGTAYMSLDGHHQNDLNPYVFKTTDYGRTWTNITGDLPWGHVNSIRQDPVNENLLYAAHEFGFFISLNEGGQWHRFMPNLPTVRVDEVVVHPRDNDLVLATHGRSVWVMDDITALQQMTPESLQQEATLFQPRDAVAWKSDPRDSTTTPGYKWWTGETAPRGTAIAYYLRNAASGEARITITNVATGEAVRTCTGTTTAGLNRFQWALSGDPQPGGGGGRGRGGRGAEPPPAPTGPPPITPCTAGGGGGGRGGGGGGGIDPGLYRVTLSLSGREVGSQTFSVLEDIWMR